MLDSVGSFEGKETEHEQDKKRKENQNQAELKILFSNLL
jgi:hypothetical protein